MGGEPTVLLMIPRILDVDKALSGSARVRFAASVGSTGYFHFWFMR